jgi:hypothetical protein
LLSLFLGPEDGSSIFLRNFNELQSDYMALHPRICGWENGKPGFVKVDE